MFPIKRTYKHGIFFFIIFLHCIFLVACNKKTEQNNETTQIFSSYTISPSGVLKSTTKEYLRFWDATTNQTVYLCNQSSCLHQNSSCAAYYPGYTTAFFYQNQLYFCQADAFFETYTFSTANLYGEERKTLQSINACCIHSSMHILDGKLYFIGNSYDKKQDKSINEAYCLDLTTGSYEKFPLQDTKSKFSYLTGFMASEDYYYELYTGANVDLKDFIDAETNSLKEIDWKTVSYYYPLFQINKQDGSTKILMSQEISASEEPVIQFIEHYDNVLLFQWGNTIYSYNEKNDELFTYYEYEGEKTLFNVKKFEDGYLLVLKDKNISFSILKDQKEIFSFSDEKGLINGYLGSVNGIAYFTGNGTLYYTPCEELLNGNISFLFIDI